tara:strand:+ start:351 stop:539 length:189 start_codon:yes stop_codon:yes gene_type:complete
MMAFMPNVGFPELLIVLFIVLLLFGAGKLPEVARSIGKSFKELKKGVKEIEKSVSDEGKKES